MSHLVRITSDKLRLRCTAGQKALLRGAVLTTLALRKVECDCQVDILYTDDEGIRRYNREQRKLDSPTDVLSFPLLTLQAGEPVIPDTLNSENGRVFLGDMVISLERAAEQAREYGHSFERELGYLAVHSTLHLLGYDHMTETERAVMRVLEEQVMEKMGLIR